MRPARRPLLPFVFAGLATLAPAAHGQTVNGCTYAAATPAWDAPARQILLGVGFSYAPACLAVRSGQSVQWSMSFTSHPLRAGEVIGGVPQAPDPGNPIQSTSSGTSVTFAFPEAGDYPYYCDNHFSFDMYGVVYVVLFADGFEDEDLCDWDAVAPAETCPP